MKNNQSPLRSVESSMRFGFLGIALFSLAINLLMLTGPIYMLQIYDRVLSSGSVPTLLALTIIIGILFAFWGLFSYIRGKLASHMFYNLEHKLAKLIHSQFFKLPLSERNHSNPLQDLTKVREFCNSPPFMALYDAPFSPIFIVVIFLLHPMLGWLTIGSIVLIVALTLLAELIASKRLRSVHASTTEAHQFNVKSSIAADVIKGLGMIGAITEESEKKRGATNALNQAVMLQTSVLTNISRSFRMFLQSLILGLGAWLVLQNEMTAGGMITASILSGRALAPIDQLLGGWRSVTFARQARSRLKEFFEKYPVMPENPILQLPEPKGKIQVDNVTKLDPAAKSHDKMPILQGINFSLEPGEGLGVIGPTGSGKSSLARLLVGIWDPDRGNVRIDGASYNQWDPDQIGEHIGYLPQEVSLLPGTVGENIARFRPDASDEKIIEASKLANIHEIVTSFPKGYNSVIDEDIVLSGGQSQRIALARAVYGSPKFLVLDEPNANLDVQGDNALTFAIKKMRDAGATVVVIAHRPSAIAGIDKILVLNKGRQADYGDKKEVLEKISKLNTQKLQLS